MKTSLHLLTAALMAVSVSATAHASVVVTQWNFNSPTPDNNTGTGTTDPSIGAGIASLLNGVTGGFASGTANGGSSDPAASDNSGWQTTGYAAQGQGNKLSGVQFAVSTLGYQDIVVRYDLRHSNTSSRYEQFQYSIDGNNFIDYVLFDGNAGDTWFNNRSVDLTGIAGVNDNASFAFRIVAAFAPNTSQYAASRATSDYGTAGTWRFDMVTVQGVAVPVPPPVPEPETYALMLAGLGLVGFMARRRRSK